MDFQKNKTNCLYLTDFMTCFSQKINWVTLSLQSLQMDTSRVSLFGHESFPKSQVHLRSTINPMLSFPFFKR